MLPKELIKVIGVDKEKCVNCHLCINACPVKYCNDGGGDVVEVNQNMCIACGNCLTVCTHEARYYIDDFSSFMIDVKAGDKIVAIVAPSVAANFHDNYLNLNGWLKSIGVEAIFDVSFGAELTVASYLHYIKTQNPQTVISQPCASIVSYLEIYKPELVKYLAPVDSPMVHTMKLIKNFYTQYKDHKIVVLSPCIAKKREFKETGYGDYNVSFISIYNFIKSQNIPLENYPKTGYDNPPAERAVLFSTPGGLLQTVERWIPEMRNRTRKIEGVAYVYDYFETLSKSIKEGKSPLLIDCLNCEKGCNGGPLTLGKDMPIDEIEHWVSKRNIEMQEYYNSKEIKNKTTTNEHLESLLMNFWNDTIYTRSYDDLAMNNDLRIPNYYELQKIYKKMHKYTEKDIYNCSACGYTRCEKMATAIFNGLNKPENCHFYLHEEGAIAHRETKKGQQRFQTILSTMVEGFVQLTNDSMIVDINQATRDLVNASKFIGKSILEFIDDDSKALFKQKSSEIATSFTSSYELVMRDTDNNQIFCVFNETILRDDENKKTGSFLIITNVTERKKVELELQKSRDELEYRVEERTQELTAAVEELKSAEEEITCQRDAIEEKATNLSQVLAELQNAQKSAEETEEKFFTSFYNSSDAALLLDGATIKHCNKATVNFYGCRSFEDVLGLTPIDFSPELQPNGKPSNAFAQEMIAQAIEKGFNRFDWTHTKLDKSEFPTEISLSLVVIKGKAYVQAIMFDLTERKLMEKKLHEQQAEVLAINEELRQTSEEIAAQRDNLEEKSVTLSLTLQQLESTQEEIKAQRDALEEKTTNLTQTLELLEKSQDKLVESEKMVALGQLIAGVAHEINTPLGAIRSSVGNITSTLEQILVKLPDFFMMLTEEEKQAFFLLLERSVNAGSTITSKEERSIKRKLTSDLEDLQFKKSDEYADIFVDMGIYDSLDSFLVILHSPNCERIMHIAYKLSGLLRSSKTINVATERASKVVFALKNFAHYNQTGEMFEANIVDSVETVLTLYYNQLKHGVTLVKNYSKDVPSIMCFPDELNQVWTNLVHNALQAMDNIGTLTVDVTSDTTNVIVSITDSGKGIPDAIKEKIFNPFFTTKAQGEGSGLGLDIVKRIIEKHGGKIGFESQPGKTTFFVNLPI